MANVRDAISENVDGLFFVDESCIDCGVCRHFAPDYFVGKNGTSQVYKQPDDRAGEILAIRGLLSCPSNSIGSREKVNIKEVKDGFPLKMDKNVYLNGFNHRNSFGGHSYFITSKKGNWMVDSPRFIPHLVRKFEEMGGLKYIFLTHRDDVGDASKYAEHFKAQRIIHQFDKKAQPDAEIIVEEQNQLCLDDGEIYHVPGHTKGHQVLLWDSKYLFTGDHFAWMMRTERFGAFENYCWHSWTEQLNSILLMRDFKCVEWVFPAHGKWGPVENGDFPKIIDDYLDEARR